MKSPPKRTITPDLLDLPRAILDVTTLRKKDTFACLNHKAEFATASFTNSEVEVTPIVPGFPSLGLEKFSSDQESLLWGFRGRGLYSVDLLSKDTGHVVVAHSGNAVVLGAIHAETPEGKIIVCEVMRMGPSMEKSPHWAVSYKTGEDTVGQKSKLITGSLHPFGSSLLWKEFFRDKTCTWHFTDHTLNDVSHNNLTKKLSESQVFASWTLHSLNVDSRMLLGYNNKIHAKVTLGKLDEDTIFSVRWSPDFSDVDIEPVLLQKPEYSTFNIDFCFSPDGKWVRGNVRRISHYPEKTAPWQIVFFHVNEKYPQGLSMPMLGEYSDPETPGAFVEHSQWGPVYVERHPRSYMHLRVYRLREGLEKVLKQ